MAPGLLLSTFRSRSYSIKHDRLATHSIQPKLTHSSTLQLSIQTETMTEEHTPKLSSIKIDSNQGQCTAGPFSIGTNTTVQFEGDHDFDFGMVLRVIASGPYRPERILQDEDTDDTLRETEPSAVAHKPETGKVFDWYQTRWRALCESKTKNATHKPGSSSGVLAGDSHLHDLAIEAFALGWTDLSVTDRAELQSSQAELRKRQADDRPAVGSLGRLSRYVGRALLSLINTVTVRAELQSRQADDRTAVGSLGRLSRYVSRAILSLTKIVTDRAGLQSRQADDKSAVGSLGRLSGYAGRELLSLIKIELTHTEYVETDERLNLFQYGPTIDPYSAHAGHGRFNVRVEDQENTNQLGAKSTAKQIEDGQNSGNSMLESASDDPGIKLLESSSSSTAS